MVVNMAISLVKNGHISLRNAEIDTVIIAGWTARNQEALERHIKELEELGVKRPSTTPIFYRASSARLTTASRIQALGMASSGEAEVVLLKLDGRLWVGVGSDHTDRELEAVGVAISKQLCDKPVGTTFWAYDEVIDHWDSLILRSHITEAGEVSLYQDGTVASMLPPEELVHGYTGGDELPEGSVMFCGTLAAKGDIRPAEKFYFELVDPVLGRKIHHEYIIEYLPVVG